MIEAAEADEFVRAAALAVWTTLTATGRIAREETEAYVLRLYDTLQPQQESFVWSGWVLAADSGEGDWPFRPMVITIPVIVIEGAAFTSGSCVVGGRGRPGEKAGRGGRLIVPAVHGRAPCAARSARHQRRSAARGGGACGLRVRSRALRVCQGTRA